MTGRVDPADAGVECGKEHVGFKDGLAPGLLRRIRRTHPVPGNGSRDVRWIFERSLGC